MGNQKFLFKEETAQAGELETIAGIEWVLGEWKSGEPAPPSPAVTLKFENGKFLGRSGCHRYSSPVTAGSTAGSIKVGPTVSTRMALIYVMFVKALLQRGGYTLPGRRDEFCNR